MAKIVKPFAGQVTRVAGRAFKCECGCQVLEEVMGGVTYTSVVKSVRDEEGFGAAEYGRASADGGEVESIQCGACGKFIASDLESLLRVSKANKDGLFVERKKGK